VSQVLQIPALSGPGFIDTATTDCFGFIGSCKIVSMTVTTNIGSAVITTSPQTVVLMGETYQISGYDVCTLI
jgi:hypothetical protein